MAVCNNLYQDLKTGVGWEFALSFALSSSIWGLLGLFLPHPPWLLLAPPFNPPCLTKKWDYSQISVCICSLPYLLPWFTSLLCITKLINELSTLSIDPICFHALICDIKGNENKQYILWNYALKHDEDQVSLLRLSNTGDTILLVCEKKLNWHTCE